MYATDIGLWILYNSSFIATNRYHVPKCGVPQLRYGQLGHYRTLHLAVRSLQFQLPLNDDNFRRTLRGYVYYAPSVYLWRQRRWACRWRVTTRGSFQSEGVLQYWRVGTPYSNKVYLFSLFNLQFTVQKILSNIDRQPMCAWNGSKAYGGNHRTKQGSWKGHSNKGPLEWNFFLICLCCSEWHFFCLKSPPAFTFPSLSYLTTLDRDHGGLGVLRLWSVEDIDRYCRRHAYLECDVFDLRLCELKIVFPFCCSCFHPMMSLSN